ncbi:PKD domain-containing protein [Methanosarcina sp. UBA5]|uniref:PKD domain-containing protein n=1 Tax=Methanosarcina sp. UBA5 TaxID=1915593 RepID=UPI0025D4E7E8|nr:PKD domain-containing protein [Methanosarcina sp. UBA5]
MWVNKFTILLAVAILLMILAYSPASAKEITVDNNGSGADFRSIQEAVTNSYSGDVILVCPGNYNESVDVTEENISILSESEDPENTIVRKFKMGANNTTISGFSIQEGLILRKYIPTGASTGYSYRDPIENCTVKNNILKLGIDAKVCHNFTFEKNVILNSGILISAPEDAVISNLRISDNLIVDGSIDISQQRGSCFLLNSGNFILLNNTVLKGRIVLNNCCGYKIIENHISNDPNAGSGGMGIALYESDSSEIENNTIVNCSSGMHIMSGSCTINNNTLTDNGQGIMVGASLKGNSFLNNTILNSNIGIFLSGPAYGPAYIGDSTGGDLLLNGGNSLLNNNISNNNIGIFFESDSSGNLVANNRVELNNQYGICVEDVSYEVPYNGTNRFYNNIFNNTVNFFNGEGNYNSNYYTVKTINNKTGIFFAIWNTTKVSGTNIVCGPYLGGNYWAKPDGTGFSQNCVDSDEDGIGDLSYKINENYTDYLPLVSVSTSQESIIPVANFSTNITQDLAPVAVQFTDLSKNAILWKWDFDSDGISDSTNQNPIYLYKTPGTYIVNLTMSNGKDTSSKNMEIILQEAKTPPVVDFKTNVTSGQVPLSVQFTDLSKNATSWVWDFNNDRITDSTEKSPVYVYTYPGTYTVNLTVDNTKGTASKLSTITTSPAQHIDGDFILTEYQITTNESDQFGPAIYKDWIAWQDDRNGNSDVYMYDLNTQEEAQITTSDSNQYYIGIYGNNIIWNDWHEGSEKRDVYLYNISTSKETQITTNKSDKWLPAIYEDKIAWIDYRSGKSDVYMYNLSTSMETQITTSEYDGKYDSKYDPDIYGDRVVWVGGGICMYNLSTSRETKITSVNSLKHHPVIYGDKIVWQDERNGNSDVYMCDLSTSRETQITTSGRVSWPAIYGNRIVYADTRNWNTDIYMYDIPTGKETQITTSGSASGPAIYGDRIVWTDSRNGLENSDIYMCTISKKDSESKKPVADFFASPTSGSAPLKVLFTDNSIGEPTSWLWDFGDGINSKHAMNATHTFTKPGTYNVTLNVTNAAGSNSIIRQSYITVKSE